MGGISSAQRGSTEEDNDSTTSVYRYPPRAGNYFSTHFIMGGEKFDSPQPESFLFGENSDLNFLGSKPVPFPYPPPQANEPTKTLKALINIRRDSLHFTKGADWNDDPGKYNIQFTLDCDVKTSVTIYYLATEEMTSSTVCYTPKYEHLRSPTYVYPKGAGQVFNQTQHIFEPLPLEMELIECRGEGVLPVVIHCTADEGDQPRQSHVTVGVVEKYCDGGFSLKTLKQKLFVDGLCYLIQEIYGVEKKVSDEMIDDEFDDTGAECVVCMCDSRDTLILPCRHLCLCYTCADSLRYQASNCPICRAPFRALLQIRALQKTGHSATHPALAAEEQTEGVPPGYELVSLVEALNGPFAPPPPPPLTLGETNTTAEGGGGKKKKSKRRGSKTGGTSKDGKRSAGSEKSLPSTTELEDENGAAPTQMAAEAVNLELTESRLCLGGDDGNVTVVDERRGSSKSLSKRSSSILEDSNKIKLEVLSQDSLRKVQDTDLINDELLRVNLSGGDLCDREHGSRVELIGDDLEEEDTKEPTTEDELLRDDKLFESKTGSLYKRDQIIHLTDDESLEAVGRGLDEGEGYFSVGSGDDEEDVEVVSIRGAKARLDSYQTTPRCSDQSSQESGTSVNSSKQLLKSSSSVPIHTSVTLRQSGESGDVVRKKKRNRSSVAPSPEQDPVDAHV